MFTSGTFSQVDPQKPERIKLVKFQDNNSTTITPEQQIARYESFLESLNKKEAYLKSDPEALKVAEENGWFAKAEETRKSVKAKIEVLKSK